MNEKLYPVNYKKSKDVQVYINGKQIEVIETGVALFVTAEYTSTARVQIIYNTTIKEVVISPKRRKIPYQLIENVLSFQLEKHEKLFIDAVGATLPLFFYGVSPQKYDGKADYYYAAGQVYEVGEIELKDNQSVYIEHGAVVLGRIIAKGAKNVKIYGNGVLDNSYYALNDEEVKTVSMVNCENVTIQDIIIVKPTTWMVLIAGCQNVIIDGIKEIGEVVSSDGIDIVGSRHVAVTNCILRNNDDCVVIKHMIMKKDGILDLSQLYKVEDIVIQNCVMFNAPAGNATEIGFELQCEEVGSILFQNIDIIRVDGMGAPISIHVCDNAMVKNIVYDNIYIEHYYEKLIDLRVITSRYTVSKERGYIKDITLKNIYVSKEEYNDGYSVSTIGGYDEEHLVENVVFDNFCFNNVPIKDINELDLFVRNAKNITVK